MRENHFLTLNRALNGAMLAAVLLTSSNVFAAEIASPESVGMSSAALNSATARLQKHIDDGEIAGVVAAVARDGKLVYQVALGKLDRERDAGMPENELFRVYSMSREITSVAALRLFEEGAFKFDDPVSKYLPEFSDQRVLLNSESTDLEATRPRVGEMTIGHLLTHTSGLGSRSSALYRENNVRDRAQSLDAMVSKAARVPLFQDPGTEFRYGIHATTIGKLIEVWSGQPFEEYLQQNLLAPLGMTSTLFWAEGNDADRLAQLYRPEAGELSPYAIETMPWTQRPVLVEGGVGLLSSVPDYVRFAQMVLDRGKIPGTEERILSESTAALMYENAVPEAAMPIGDSRYWLGSAGTRFFIDPIEGTVIVIMAQVSPSNGGGFRENFSHLVDAAIIERR
ncbi:beta-lactamase family protein [Gammaproteobacteria bacterium]|nr:beta-lactamase family protein [Gammaproteobacteria bacterium]